MSDNSTSSASAEQPVDDTSRGTGRLPSKPSPLIIGPLKRYSPNYQLFRANEYLEESNAIIRDVALEHPDFTTHPEFDRLTLRNKEVFNFYDEVVKGDQWEIGDAHRAKIRARVQRKEAKRTSDRATATKIRSLARPIPQNDATSVSRPYSPTVGVEVGLFEAIIPADQDPVMPPDVDPNNGRVFGNQPLVPADPSDDTVSESEMADGASETIPLIPLTQVTVEPVTA